MSIKIAKTKHNIIDLIKNRWSPRSFLDKPISENDLQAILEAGSWAFSAMNAQPWQFVYAHKQDSVGFTKLLHCLMPGNQPWAKIAAVLMAVLVQKKYENGTENRTAFFDVGAANATLILQATSMNIYGHVMGGFDMAKAIETLKINPETLEPAVFMALGYLDAPEKLEEPFKGRELTPRNRKPVSDFAKKLE